MSESVRCAACGYTDDWKTLDFHGRTVCGDVEECRVRAARAEGYAQGKADGVREQNEPLVKVRDAAWEYRLVEHRDVCDPEAEREALRALYVAMDAAQRAAQKEMGRLITHCNRCGSEVFDAEECDDVFVCHAGQEGRHEGYLAGLKRSLEIARDYVESKTVACGLNDVQGEIANLIRAEIEKREGK